MIPNKCTIKDYKTLLREANEEIEAREKHIRYLENKNQELSEENAKLKELLKECYNMLAQHHVENSEPSLDENIQLLTKIDKVLK